MKKLWKYLFKYKLLFFSRILTISLAALSVICFDFMMGFSKKKNGTSKIEEVDKILSDKEKEIMSV